MAAALFSPPALELNGSSSVMMDYEEAAQDAPFTTSGGNNGMVSMMPGPIINGEWRWP